MPGSLSLPECWLEGDSISQIVINYEGPPLNGSTITFTCGTLVLSNTPDNDITVAPFVGEQPEGKNYTEVITITTFEPQDNGEVKYKLVVDYAPGGPLNRRTLKKGTWHIAADD